MAVSKPLPGAQISPSSPWAQGLIFALPFNEQAGANVQNYAPAVNQTVGVGTGLLRVASPSGGAIRTNGSSAYVRFQPVSGLVTTGAFTSFTRFKLNTLATGSALNLWADAYNGSTTQGGLNIGFNLYGAGIANLLIDNQNAYGGKGTTNFTTLVGRWVDLLCSYDPATGYRLEVNGVNEFVLVTSGGSRAASQRDLALGGVRISGSPTRFLDADFDCHLHWEGRTFTAAEKAALRANPWQLWPDEPQLVFAPAAPIPVPFYCAPQSAVSKPLPGQRIDRTAPLAQNIAAFWPFNEGAGTGFADAIGNAHGRSIYGVTWGKNGVVFNGNSYISTPPGRLAITKTTKFSIVIKCSFTAVGYSTLFSNYDNATGGYEILVVPSGGLVIYIGGVTNGIYVTTNAAYNDGKPRIFGFDYDGSVTTSGFAVFVDGKKVAVTPTSAGTGDPGTWSDYGVWIGARHDGAVGKYVGQCEFAGMCIGGILGPTGHQALAANPWKLWGDDQIAFAPGGSSVTVNVTGFAGTGSVGNSVPLAVTFPTSLLGTGAQGTINPQLAYTPSGSAGTGTQGTPTYAYSGNVFPTGIEGTGAIGTPNYQALFVPAGSEGTGAIGSTAPLVVFAPTGVAGTGSIGTTTPQVLLTPTGYVGTGDVGSVTFTIASTFIPAGLEGVSALGSTLELVTLTPTGQAGTGSIGTPTFASGSTFVATGVEGVGALGGVYPVVTFTPAGLAGTSAQGSPVPQVAFNPTGQAGAGQQGTVAFIINSTYSPDGIQAAGQVGSVTLLGWLVIQDGQTPGWGAVGNTQTPSWSQVTAAQTPNWSQPSTAQTPSWTDETTTQVPIWTPVDTQE